MLVNTVNRKVPVIGRPVPAMLVILAPVLTVVGVR